MLSTSEKIRTKLAEVLQTSSLRQADIAEACGVSKQAIQGWIKTGRIDKKHLPALASISGRPLSWWLDAEESNAQPSDQALLDTLQGWRFKASSRSQKVIDQLCVLAQKNALRDEDWNLIEQMVKRLRSQQ